jgi:hypothetical protein
MTKSDRTDLNAFGKSVAALISTVLGQLPSIATLMGFHPFISLYQPSIYQGKEFFLLVPFMVGLFATWSVLRWPKAMWVVFLIFLILAVFVYYVYENYGPLSPLHPINWIMSYCAFALFVAALTRLTIDAVIFFRSV